MEKSPIDQFLENTKKDSARDIEIGTLFESVYGIDSDQEYQDFKKHTRELGMSQAEVKLALEKLEETVKEFDPETEDEDTRERLQAIKDSFLNTLRLKSEELLAKRTQEE